MFSDDDIKNIFRGRPEALIVVLAVVVGIVTVGLIGAQEIQTNPHGYTQNFIAELEAEAEFYKGDLVWSSDNGINNSIKVIQNTDDCDKLSMMFTVNTGWNARNMLADKILTNCM